MKFPCRLKRALLVGSAILGTIIALVVAFIIFAIGMAIAYSGASSGGAALNNGFSLIPALHFVAGFIGFGGAMALLNAIATSQGWWFKSIMLVATAGGIACLVYPSLAETLIAMGKPIANLVGAAFFHH